jgi:hypothetical protein
MPIEAIPTGSDKGIAKLNERSVQELVSNPEGRTPVLTRQWEDVCANLGTNSEIPPGGNIPI